MKVERKEKAFEPVVITLESQDELVYLEWALWASQQHENYERLNFPKKDFIAFLRTHINEYI